MSTIGQRFHGGQIIKSTITGETYFVKRWPDNIVSISDNRSYSASADSDFKVIINNFKFKQSWMRVTQ